MFRRANNGGELTSKRMKEVNELRPYIEYIAHEVSGNDPRQNGFLAKRSAIFASADVQAHVYIEIEALVIPLVKEAVMKYLQVESLHDGAMIMQTMAAMQARGLPVNQNEFKITSDMQMRNKGQSPYVQSFRKLEELLHENWPT